MTRLLRTGGFVLGLTCVVAADDISFNRDILPILSNNCFVCHGPDNSLREADLRLDQLEYILDVVTPGDPEGSELMSRVRATRASKRMPPHETGKTLSDKEIALLQTWIEQGAVWEEHWSYVLPVRAALPSVSEPAWCLTPIDRFVLARLDEEGLSPNPEADKRTLLRRVTLDLIGLPPTPSDVQAFLGDESPNAYDRVVDRLLASPHFGEHAARPWLDLARYADSQGYEKDSLRTMWRYRDWVINAFNNDMPFDQFTREQLAGDLLPDATVEQRIATGFHRNTQTNTEGGTDDEEFRAAAVIDRVNTTMQGWMGLTAGCAQCHDHKYDPFTQQEYFELYAFFNQTKDNDAPSDQPFIKAPTGATVLKLAQNQLKIDAINATLEAPDTALKETIATWLAESITEDDWRVLRPAAAETNSDATLEILEDGVIVAGGPVPLVDVYTLRFEDVTTPISALRLEVIEAEDGVGPGRSGHGNFVVNELEFRVGDATTPTRFGRAEATHNQLNFVIDEAIDGKDDPLNGWAVAPVYNKGQTAVFAFDAPLTLADGQASVTIRQSHGTQHTLAQFRLSATAKSSARLPLSGDLATAAAVMPDDRTPEQWLALATAAVEERPSLVALRTEQERLAGMVPTALVMAELPITQRRKTYLFNRGTFLVPDTERGVLEPGVPEVMHALDVDVPSRLDLAEWLVAADNPLTARVQVNRLWGRLFGRGLVSSVENFGVQGMRPSHPELLDFLAAHWQEDLKWSPKALARLLVLSATYRQASHIDPVVLARDPRNRLLSRVSRVRLSAEALRDSALAVAGLLVESRIGGPSVLPHLPKGMLPQAFTGFVAQASTGDDLYRRGLYTQWRRTGHYPTFATFDAPSREFCLVSRERSNTPLQALAMLNDKVFVEAAQAIGRRVVAMETTIDGRIERAFELALAREPEQDEARVLREVYDEAYAVASDDPDGAMALATIPIGPLPEGVQVEVAAAMTVVGNVILNLDEFVNRP